MGLRRKRSSCSQGQSSSLLAVACILLLAVPISALNSLPVENPLPLGIGQSKGQNQPNSNSNPVAIHQPYPDRQPLRAQTVETGNKAKVAIIGGGIAGIYLADLLESNDPGLISTRVTIFDKEPQFGGRIGTAYQYDGLPGNRWTSTIPTDTGAHTFDSDDTAIGDMIRKTSSEAEIESDFLLGSDQFGTILHERASTWDGQTLHLNPTDDVPVTWGNAVGTVQTYLLSPRYWYNVFSSLNKKSVSDHYIDPLFQGIRNLLDHDEENWAWHRFQSRVKELFIQTRPGPDQGSISDFSERYFISSKPQVSLWGGLGILLNRVVKQLGQRKNFFLNLQSTVTKLTRRPDSTWDVHWTVQSPGGLTENHNETFDSVIIAAPLGQAHLRFEPSLPITPDNTSYTPLHVTNFITGKILAREAFNSTLHHGRGSFANGPNIIWNVQSDGKTDPGNSCSTPPFISITRLFSTVLDDDRSIWPENLYRVVSTAPFTDDDIAALMKKCGKARESVTFPDQSCYKLTNGEGGFLQYHFGEAYRRAGILGPTYWMDRDECFYKPWIRWVNRKFWPNGLPVVDGNRDQPAKDDQLELAPGLFYVSGFEGRRGASLSDSTNNARKIKDMLVSKYLNIQDRDPRAGSDV